METLISERKVRRCIGEGLSCRVADYSRGYDLFCRRSVLIFILREDDVEQIEVR